MKVILIIAIVVLTAGNLIAQEIRLFNPEVLGRSAEKDVKLLLPADSKAIEPQSIQVDLKDQKYSGAMLHYGPEVSLEQAKESLNKKYRKFEQPSFKDDTKMGLWRDTDRRFAIQVTRTEDGLIRVIYLPFTEAEKR